MPVSPSAIQRNTGAYTAPISTTPVKVGFLQRALNFLNRIINCFSNKASAAGLLAQEALKTAHDMPVVNKTLASRPAAKVDTAPKGSPVLRAKSLSDTAAASIPDAIASMQPKVSLDESPVVIKQAADTPETVNTAGPADTAQPVDTAEPMDTIGTVDAAETVDATEAVDTVESVDTAGTVDTAETVDTAGAVGTTETVDTAGAVDTTETVDTAETVDTSEPGNTANTDTAWDAGFAASDHSLISEFAKGMRTETGDHVNAPASPTPHDVKLTEELEHIQYAERMTQAQTNASPVATSANAIAEPVAALVQSMRSDAGHISQGPRYDAPALESTVFPSQRTIKPNASDKELIGEFLKNMQHSIGSGPIRRQPDSAGAIANVTGRMGTTTKSLERAIATHKMVKDLAPQQLAPIGRSATFSIAKPQSGDGNNVRTVSDYALPQDKTLNATMKDALDTSDQNVRTYEQFSVATTFVDQIDNPAFNLTIIPAKNTEGGILNLFSAKKSQLENLFEACFNDETVMQEVTRHLNPNSVTNAIMAQFGNGNGRMIIDGTHVDLAQALPTFSYVVKSDERRAGEELIDVMDITVEAQWDMRSFTGALSERLTPLGGAKSTFTAVVNFLIIPQVDADGNVATLRSDVTVNARTSVSNLIGFGSNGTRT